jgi:uncharacterized protein
MYYTRSIHDAWLEASAQFPALLLTGPRQVGKTTFLRHICESRRRYVTMDDPNMRAVAQQDPELFFQRFEPPILIDEIQYAPSLLSYIKMIVDRKRKVGMFWMTGSQQFQIMKGISETLAGRVAIMNMLGFSRRERHRLELKLPPFIPDANGLAGRLKSHASSRLKSVYQDIWTGAFPALATGSVKNRDLFYSSYLQTYLQRDVRDLAQVGNETGFLRFLKVCAARTGQLLNISDLARDADVSVNTAKSWLSVLQGSFQIYLLPPYHSNVTQRLVKAPKLYFLDTGLCAFLTDWSSPETLESGAMSGAIFETHVFSEILKSWWHRGQFPQMHYYRDKDKREIDLVILQNRTFFPIEIKKTGLPARAAAKTLAVLGRFPEKKGPGAVVCLAQEILPLDTTTNAVPAGYV